MVARKKEECTLFYLSTIHMESGQKSAGDSSKAIKKDKYFPSLHSSTALALY